MWGPVSSERMTAKLGYILDRQSYPMIPIKFRPDRSLALFEIIYTININWKQISYTIYFNTSVLLITK